LDLGAEPFLIASALSGIVGQRIARKICPQCKEEYTPDDTVTRDIKDVLGALLPPDKPIKLYRGKGTINGVACQTCGGSMYYGRLGVFEVFSVSDTIGKLILKRSPMKDIESQAISEGMMTMKQDGYMKALEGLTSLEEVLRVAQD
jgi:type II secretory ATPase GspE/PulE/Tfp pilus assembly ATPase PilB-like protein